MEDPNQAANQAGSEGTGGIGPGETEPAKVSEPTGGTDIIGAFGQRIDALESRVEQLIEKLKTHGIHAE